jgi:glycosyltransferase involved in cell wall biosynthesis
MTAPLVSTIIPTYAGVGFILDAIQSALAQTYPHQEIIVINDGSPDNTEALLEPYRDRIVYIAQPNRGFAIARNVGILRATGKYVAFLDHDDIWLPAKLALQVAYLEANPEITYLASDFSGFSTTGFFELSNIRSYYSLVNRTPGGFAGIFSDKSKLSTRDLPHLAADVPAEITVWSGDAYRRLLWGNCLHPPTGMWPRALLPRVGLMDPLYRRDSDWEYILRFARLGKVALMDIPLIKYRYTDQQLSDKQHTGDLALTRIFVLEDLAQRDPELGATADFRQRLAFAYLAVADALAEQKPMEALGHLGRSIRHGWLDTTTIKTFAKAVLPRGMLEQYRRYK